MNVGTLKERLASWTDVDVAGYELAVALGLMNPNEFSTKYKHVFWSTHPIGDLLLEMLAHLAAVHVLERRDEPDLQYRWNPSFTASWN